MSAAVWKWNVDDLHSPGFAGEGPVHEADPSRDDEHKQEAAAAVYG